MKLHSPVSCCRPITPPPLMVIHPPLRVDIITNSLSNERQSIEFPWINIVRLTKIVEQELGDTLNWYNDTGWEKINSRVLDEKCLEDNFSPFMWQLLKSKLPNQALLKLCDSSDNLPSEADIIMSIAIQIDNFPAWRTVSIGNHLIVSGYDKLVWYSGSERKIQTIISASPSEMIAFVRSILTRKFKERVVRELILLYHEHFEEKIVRNKVCTQECDAEMYRLHYDCLCYRQHKEVPGYCCTFQILHAHGLPL